jgi:purine-binding chemotaxis protein CheW
MSTLHVICKLGEAEYALSADDVYQMETYSGATPVPGASTYVAGIIQVRQKIVPVLDLRARFGMEVIPPTAESRVVVLSISDRLVGILVDSAREVQNIEADQFKAPPDIVTQQSNGFIKSIVAIKDRIILLIDPLKVIGEELTHV